MFFKLKIFTISCRDKLNRFTQRTRKYDTRKCDKIVTETKCHLFSFRNRAKTVNVNLTFCIQFKKSHIFGRVFLVEYWSKFSFFATKSFAKNFLFIKLFGKYIYVRSPVCGPPICGQTRSMDRFFGIGKSISL